LFFSFVVIVLLFSSVLILFVFTNYCIFMLPLFVVKESYT